MSRTHAWIILAAVVLLASCSRDYVTGRPTFNIVSEDSEVELGREYDQYLLAEHGTYDDESLAAYVERIGQELAATSHRTNIDYTFRVLDSPVVNAFALPGGYIYVTRGIIVHLDSEDALATVMGHEVGHVVARHSAKQMSRQAFTSPIGKLPLIGGILSAPFDLMLLSYGRGQENQSDELGVEYATELGYDASQMAGFFELLQRMNDKDGEAVPTFQSTHPDPGDRAQNVRELSAEMQEETNYKPRNLDADDFLRRLDGVVYGDNPRHGFVEGNVYYHPELAFQFPVPQEWEAVNTAARVFMISKDEMAMIMFGLWESESPEAAARQFIEENEIPVVREGAGRVNGMRAYVVESAYVSSKGSIHYLSYFIQNQGETFVFHGMTTDELYAKYSPTFIDVMEGFDVLTDPEILAVQPRRVRIQAATRDGTFGEVCKALGAADSQLDGLAELNGRTADTPVTKGELIKLVR